MRSKRVEVFIALMGILAAVRAALVILSLLTAEEPAPRPEPVHLLNDRDSQFEQMMERHRRVMEQHKAFIRAAEERKKADGAAQAP